MNDGYHRCHECAYFVPAIPRGYAYCMAVWLEMSDRDLWYYCHYGYSKKFVKDNRRAMVTFANNIACPQFKPGRAPGDGTQGQDADTA